MARSVQRPCKCLQPKCVCVQSLMISNEPPGSGRRMRLQGKADGRLASISTARRRRGKGVILVPQWTQGSCNERDLGSRVSLETGPIRFTLMPAEVRPPAHLQGLSRWTITGDGCRCRSDNTELAGVFTLVDAALHEFSKLVQLLLDNLGRYYSTRGVNAFMRDLESALRGCWDWGRLAYAPVGSSNLVALKKYTLSCCHACQIFIGPPLNGTLTWNPVGHQNEICAYSTCCWHGVCGTSCRQMRGVWRLRRCEACLLSCSLLSRHID